MLENKPVLRSVGVSNSTFNAVVGEFRVTMDFFHHRYYKINKILMSIIGLWPYQNARVGLGVRLSVYFMGICFVIPQVIAIVKYHDNVTILLEGSITFIVFVSVAMKLLFSRLNLKKMLQLLDRIRTSWKVWARVQEINVLHEYAEYGRKMTLMYTVILYSVSIFFITLPTIPTIIDVLLNNGSKPIKLPYPSEYYIDERKYYFYIVAHGVLSAILGFTILVANDTMFIVYVQHCCGIFAALGHHLKRIRIHEKVEKSGKTASALNKKDRSLVQIAWCIDGHNNAIEYAKLIDSTYSWCFMFIMGLNMIVMSITGLQIVNGTIDSQETTRFIVANITSLVHLYIENYMAQILMDHSISIRYYIHNGKWYGLSLKAQRTLNLMIMRCNASCKLTAGKITVMSVENFAVILKTSISCFTVLRSM